MKNLLKKIFRQLGIFEKLQFHPLNRIYRNKTLRKRYFEQLHFYKELLGENKKLIFDVGANVGDTAHMFRRIADKVIALEPDDQNCKILRARFGNSKHVIIIQKAVSSVSGETEFFIDAPGSAFNTLSKKWVNVLQNTELTRFGSTMKFGQHKKVETTTLDLLISQYGNPDFIKIDVEGFELEVIKGLTKSVNRISVECNFPEFYAETIEIIQYLNELNPAYRFNYYNEHSFLLPDFIDAREMISILEKTNLRFFEIFCQLNQQKL
jgi:FkbM family methyltransferase